MKKLGFLALLLAMPLAAFGSGTRATQADSLVSSDLTKSWLFPAASDTFCGLAAVQTVSGKKTFSGGIDGSSTEAVHFSDPTSSTSLATKNYVDTQLAQLNPAAAVVAASTANVAGTYSNAVSGVCIGDTFTTTATTAFALDTVTVSLNARVLFKNQTSSFQDGIWVLTTQAVGGVSGAILTRATDFDSSADINAGSIVPVSGGSQAGSSWYQTAVNTTCNTSSQTWTVFQQPSSAYLSATATSNSTLATLSALATIGGANVTFSTYGAGVPFFNSSGLMTSNSASNGQLLQSAGIGSAPAFSATPTLGINGTTQGILNLATSTSSGASIALQNGGATTGYNFNLPTTVGMANQILLSQAGGSSAMTWSGLSALLDTIAGSTRGSLLERGSGGWTVLAPSSTSGFVLTSNGTGADPTYQASGGGGGSSAHKQRFQCGTGAPASSVTLLLNFDQGSTIGNLKDFSSNALGGWTTPCAVGVVDATNVKFGAGAFDGSGAQSGNSCINNSSGTINFENLGSGNFGIGLQVNPTSTANQDFFGLQNSGSNAWAIGIVSGKIGFGNPGVAFPIAGTSSLPTAGTYHYLEVDRISGTDTFSIDGVSVGTGSDAQNYNGTTLPVRIGSNTEWNGSATNSFIDEITVSNVALHTSFPFTPPTIPTPITNTIEEDPDSTITSVNGGIGTGQCSVNFAGSPSTGDWNCQCAPTGTTTQGTAQQSNTTGSTSTASLIRYIGTTATDGDLRCHCF